MQKWWIAWLIGWLVGWLVDWLIDSFIHVFSNWVEFPTSTLHSQYNRHESIFPNVHLETINAAISRHFLQRISLWRWKTIHYLLVLLGTRFMGIEGEDKTMRRLWSVKVFDLYPIYLLYPQISSPGLLPIKHSVTLQVPSRKDNKKTKANTFMPKVAF